MSNIGTRTILTLFACALLPLAGGCADPAADAPAAVVEEAPPAETDEVPVGAPYTFTDDSTIGFVGSKVTGSHDGGFERFSGTINLVEGSPEGSDFEVEIDTTSLWSDNDRLTNHLKSADFFEVDTYPTATFESSSIAAAAEGGYTVTGTLDLHGVSKQITFPAQIEVGEEEIRASAEFSLKRFDFGIEYKGKADDLIRDDVLVKLDLVATPSTPAV